MATPITPEDGTGLPDATSYASETEFAEYLQLTGRGGTPGAGTLSSDPDAVRAALNEATIYLDVVYGDSVPSSPLTTGQALVFPRSSLTDKYGNTVAGVPIGVTRAAVELAYRKLVTPGQPLLRDPTVDSSGQPVKRRKTGPLETEFFSQAQIGANAYPIVSRLMAPYTRAGSGRVLKT